VKRTHQHEGGFSARDSALIHPYPAYMYAFGRQRLVCWISSP